MYKNLTLSSIDVSEAVKLLIEQDRLAITIDDTKGSLFDSECQPGAAVHPPVEPSPPEIQVPTTCSPTEVVQGQPVRQQETVDEETVSAPKRPKQKKSRPPESDSSDNDDCISTGKRQAVRQQSNVRAARRQVPVSSHELEPPPAAAPKTYRQSLLQPRVTLRECFAGDPLITQKAVEPPLTGANGAGRFVFTPAHIFGVDDAIGWIGRIVKVSRDANQTTKIKYHDKVHYFKFAFVVAEFKTLT